MLVPTKTKSIWVLDFISILVPTIQPFLYRRIFISSEDPGGSSFWGLPANPIVLLFACVTTSPPNMSSCCSSPSQKCSRGSTSLRESGALGCEVAFLVCLMFSHSTRNRFHMARRKTSRNCVHSTKASLLGKSLGTNFSIQLNLKKESAVTMSAVRVNPYRSRGRRQMWWQESTVLVPTAVLVCPFMGSSMIPNVEGIPARQAVWATLYGSCIIPQSMTMSQYNEYDALMVKRATSIRSRRDVSSPSEKVLR
mmetsp:Transcript_854/g.2141  ORF Transcript_854/g.2141 Transcript_854/m.2141 type:complete len:252 (-) Transcript_854:1120-1875(-)